MPDICAFIGIGGQVDEVFRIISTRVLVSFAESPTCPRLHPLPGSSGPIKHKYRESRMWVKNKWGSLDELADFITSRCISISFHWWLKKMLQAVCFKEAPGFSLGLPSVEFMTCKADSKAKQICQSNIKDIFCSSSANQYIFVFTEAVLTETRAFCLHKSPQTGHSLTTNWSFGSCFLQLVAVKSNISSFLARGLTVPLLP